jgi:pilus assembly protein Flp/PilA
MITLFKNLWNDESGQGLVEYALILALVAIVVIGALTLVGGSVKTKFEKVNTELNRP